MIDWLHNGDPVQELPDEFDHFVYLITRIDNGKKYVGKKKGFSLTTKPPLKGYKRKRKVRKESDWRTYYGSNDELNTDVVEHGEANFTREILHWCRSASEASYLEAYEQFTRNAIIDPLYYNNWIQVRITRKHLLKLSEEFVNKIPT